jgi:hypothetical protein
MKHFVHLTSIVISYYKDLGSSLNDSILNDRVLPSNVYRLYVNDELFSERTWVWENDNLEENLLIEAEPGEYTISYTPVIIKNTSVSIPFVPGKLSVIEGPAEIIDDTHFRILE